jgi:23S rRNA pseudouridine955/2504/2580 synthase
LFNLPKRIDYIYEDENIAIVFKPQGILSNSEKNTEEPTLDDLVKKENPGYIICHRLDRNTAGLVIFAKNDLSYNSILSGFKTNSINKEYITYVAYSKFKKIQDTLEQYIYTDKVNGKSKIFNLDNNIKEKNVKKITTSYKVLYTNTKDDFAILKVYIHNGKTHQIRAVLSNLGHPIIGDSKYGKNELNKKFNKYKQLLFAVSFKFNFEENSYLNYLNKKIISLDDNYYMNYIGDIYEKVTES